MLGRRFSGVGAFPGWKLVHVTVASPLRPRTFFFNLIFFSRTLESIVCFCFFFFNV